jgi:hypothetical protein
MAIGDPYLTRAQLKHILNIDPDNTEEDVEVDRALAGASRALENRSGWPTFWKTDAPVTRTVDVTGRLVPVRRSGYAFYKLLLRDGIASATGFSVNGTSSAVLLPEDAIQEGVAADAIRLPFGMSFGSYGTATITAQWGWPEVPADIIMATQMQAHRFYDRKGSPGGLAGSAEWGISRIPALDPDVLAILKGGGYMRAGIG